MQVNTNEKWMFIVPYEVSSDAVNNKEIFDTLYQMFPILVVLGLVVAIVGMFAYNYRNNN